MAEEAAWLSQIFGTEAWLVSGFPMVPGKQSGFTNPLREDRDHGVAPKEPMISLRKGQTESKLNKGQASPKDKQRMLAQDKKGQKKLTMSERKSVGSR